MGLDMYFEKSIYIGNNYKGEEHPWNKEPMTKIDIPGIDEERVTSIRESVGYLRKANAIHKWLVDNLNNGEDNNGENYFPKEKIEELLTNIKLVLGSTKLVKGMVHNGTTYSKEKGEQKIIEKGKLLEDCSIAEEVLPTQSGFFFGNTEYNEYYWQDLKEMKKICEHMLKDDTASYYYISSW